LNIGVLALQGCVDRHQKHIEACGAKFFEVKNSKDLKNIDGLILPGGESSTMLKALHNFDFFAELKTFCEHKAVWGICAGAILLAKEVVHPEQESLGLVDIRVARNAYGSQLDSFNTSIRDYTVSFIRAPKFEILNAERIEILDSQEAEVLCLRQGNIMLSAFHPELNESAPSPWHSYFVNSFLTIA